MAFITFNIIAVETKPIDCLRCSLCCSSQFSDACYFRHDWVIASSKQTGTPSVLRVCRVPTARPQPESIAVIYVRLRVIKYYNGEVVDQVGLVVLFWTGLQNNDGDCLLKVLLNLFEFLFDSRCSMMIFNKYEICLSILDYIFCLVGFHGLHY